MGKGNLKTRQPRYVHEALGVLGIFIILIILPFSTCDRFEHILMTIEPMSFHLRVSGLIKMFKPITRGNEESCWRRIKGANRGTASVHQQGESWLTTRSSIARLSDLNILVKSPTRQGKAKVMLVDKMCSNRSSPRQQ